MSSNIKKASAEGRCGFQKGGSNPSKSEECRNGRNSVWSMNFKGYDSLSDEEKIAKIKGLRSADLAYDNFAGLSEGRTGSVRFIIETDEIK